MLLILYLISSGFLVWNIDAQKSQSLFGFGQLSSNFDFDSIFFGNHNGYTQDGGGNDYSELGNTFSGASSSNTQQPSTNNGFVGNKKVSSNKLNAGASQQPVYQDNSAPQSQQNFQTSSQYQQNSYPQSQQQSFQRNTQTQQQSYQQNAQGQQQLYQQNGQPQQQLYNQNVQAQQQLHQQNSQTQQQLHQNNGQKQQQSFQQNGQPQQQVYQQNGQPQQQVYQQNGKPHQQSYQQNQNFAGNNGGFSKNENTYNPTANVLTTSYGQDGTRTGKPKQNANYNNATFAITRFGLKMFKVMNRDYQNIVASPYSVATLLALVQQGARGDTQQEITQLLQLTPESSANLIRMLTTYMKKRSSLNVFKVGSNVVLANEFDIDPKFKAAALNNFGSDVRRMDFKNTYNAAQQINQWVAGQTNQKIQNLLVPEAIQQDTLAMLVNAVYFKGVWAKKFDPQMTTHKEFTMSDGSKKVASFMESRRTIQVDTDPALKSQILLMPFEGTQYTMMFILPFEGVYAVDVLSSLTEEQLYSYQSISQKEGVKVEIPKFNIKKDSDMSFILNLLGLWKIFSPEVDLTGMGKSHQGQSPKISSGLHSAVLSIDEQGSTAAAATVFSVVALSYDDPSFVANRPFLAILWDKELSLPLFMAKIEDPES